jgi:hypothetical protein
MKESEVCHWIVSVNANCSPGRCLKVFRPAPDDQIQEQAIDFARLLSVNPIIGNAFISVTRA